MRGHERKDQRYRARVAVTLLSRAHDTAAVTEDVGYRGVFLRMEKPPSKMQLLRMKLTLPDGSDIVVHGVGKHVVERSTARHGAGIGVEFFGMDGVARKKWEAFVQDTSRVPGALVPEHRPPVASELAEIELSDDDLLEVIEPSPRSADFEVDVVVSMPPAA